MLQQKIELNQQLKLTPQLMQSLNILALNQIELVQFIETLYTENPCVEIAYEDHNGEDRCLFPESHSKGQANEEDDFDLIGSVEDLSNQNSLEEYLLSQIRFSQLNQEEDQVIRFIVHNLDENGFYPLTPTQTVGFLKTTTTHVVLHCLSILQALEPCGICTQNLKDCLCKQLDALADAKPSYYTIVNHCLDLFAQSKFHSISNQFQIPLAEIESFKSVVLKLNPKPGASFGNKTSTYIIPDIFIVDRGCGPTAILNDKYIPKVFVSNYYRQFSAPDENTQKYIEHKITSAEWAIKCLEKRRETLLHLSQEIIAANEPFFRTGKGVLSSLRMQDVADKIGVHISTVSRCVRGKYLQCSYGTYLLKAFFNKTLAISDQAFTAPEESSELLTSLSALIQKEDKKKPYSDEKLAQLLKEQGFDVARRTVVKYRGVLNIPSSLERKSLRSA